jgi:AraC-like DNA-binding protein
MEYKTEDYILREERTNEVTNYYVRFLGQTPSPEIEISESLFSLYLTEFRKPLTKYENELRRHIDKRPISSISENEFTIWRSRINESKRSLSASPIMKIINECPKKHARRFCRRYIDGYTVAEIAKEEGCSRQSVFNSIEAVKVLVIYTYRKNAKTT